MTTKIKWWPFEAFGVIGLITSMPPLWERPWWHHHVQGRMWDMYLVCIDLILMTFSDIIDAIIFQCHPIIPGPHYLSCHHVPTGMCTTDPFMNLMYNFFWPHQHQHTSTVFGLYFSCKVYLRLERIPWLSFSRFSFHFHLLILGTADPWYISKCHGIKGFHLAFLRCKRNELVILELLTWPVEFLC